MIAISDTACRSSDSSQAEVSLNLYEGRECGKGTSTARWTSRNRPEDLDVCKRINTVRSRTITGLISGIFALGLPQPIAGAAERACWRAWAAMRETPLRNALPEALGAVPLTRNLKAVNNRLASQFLPLGLRDSIPVIVSLAGVPLDTADASERRHVAGVLSELIIGKGIRELEIPLHPEAPRSAALLGQLLSVVESLCDAPLGIALDGGLETSPRQLHEHRQVFQGDSRIAPWMERILYWRRPVNRDHLFSKEVLALFAEWPSRPAMLVGPEPTDPRWLTKVLEWGYAGLSTDLAFGLLTNLEDRCLIAARKDREPVAKFQINGRAIGTDAPADIHTCAIGAAALDLPGIVLPASVCQSLPYISNGSLMLNLGSGRKAGDVT